MVLQKKKANDHFVGGTENVVSSPVETEKYHKTGDNWFL